jgi:hypothetical protein
MPVRVAETPIGDAPLGGGVAVQRLDDVTLQFVIVVMTAHGATERVGVVHVDVDPALVRRVADIAGVFPGNIVDVRHEAMKAEAHATRETEGERERHT